MLSKYWTDELRAAHSQRMKDWWAERKFEQKLEGIRMKPAVSKGVLWDQPKSISNSSMSISAIRRSKSSGEPLSAARSESSMTFGQKLLRALRFWG